MNRLRIGAVLVTMIALAAFSVAAKKPDGGGATELAVFGAVPDGTMDVLSNGPVIVGTDVQTYSPSPIELFLSDALVSQTGIPAGSHWGKARCLKKNATEGGRLDFYFDCAGDDLNTCSCRLIVRFGIYERKADMVMFDPGSMVLYQGGQLVKEGNASFSVAFPE